MMRKRGPILDKRNLAARAKNRMEETLLRGKLYHFGKQVKQVERDLLHIKESRISLANGFMKQNQVNKPQDNNQCINVEANPVLTTVVSRAAEKSPAKESLNDNRMKGRLNKLRDDAQEKAAPTLSAVSSLQVVMPKSHSLQIPEAVPKMARFGRRHSDVSGICHVPTTCLPNIAARRYSTPNAVGYGASSKGTEQSWALPKLETGQREGSTIPILVIEGKAKTSLNEAVGRKTNQDLLQEACFKSKFRQLGHAAIATAVMNRGRRYSLGSRPPRAPSPNKDEVEPITLGSDSCSQVEKLMKMRQEEIEQSTRIAWDLKCGAGLTHKGWRYSEPCVLQKN